jgi:hypothetical protein
LLAESASDAQPLPPLRGLAPQLAHAGLGFAAVLVFELLQDPVDEVYVLPGSLH